MNLELFENKNEFIQLEMPNADVVYYPYFFEPHKSNHFFESLLKKVDWKQDTITVFGKTHPQPRLTALFGNNSKAYNYSGITMTPQPFNKELLLIKKNIEIKSGVQFTTCLLNLYRDGQDSNGWHADNEKELGKNPIIASISFGAERWFHLKHRIDKKLKQKICLKHGSLLIMKGTTQEFWLHQIPKTKKVIDPRINLTFRLIL